MTPRGLFELEYLPPDGSPGWAEVFPNGVTYDGVNAFLNAQFRFGYHSTQWYLGLISDVAYTGLSNLDTYHVHRGWMDYPYWDAGQLTRPLWQPGEPAGGVIASLTPSAGTVTLGGRIRGIHLSNVKAFGPGTVRSVLWSTGVMAAGRTVAAGGVLRARYTTRIGG